MRPLMKMTTLVKLTDTVNRKARKAATLERKALLALVDATDELADQWRRTKCAAQVARQDGLACVATRRQIDMDATSLRLTVLANRLGTH